jgi:DNA-binding NarL/FixJ family response regulator
MLNDDPRFNVLPNCCNDEEAVQSAKEKEPELIMMDIGMSPFSGLETALQIQKI